MRVLLICLLALGCEAETVSDQCLRATLFKECMAGLPKGPSSTHYNDWDDVVDSCETAAYYQSLRQRRHIKPECQP